MKKLSVLLLMAILLTACGPSAADLQASISMTQTAMPTSTPTPKPIPPIRECLLEESDFQNMGRFYSFPPMLLKDLVLDKTLDQINGNYVSPVDDDAIVVFSIIYFEDTATARERYTNLTNNKLHEGKAIYNIDMFDLPTTTQFIDSDDGSVSASFTEQSVLVHFIYVNRRDSEPGVIATFLGILLAAQRIHLEDCGFIN